MDEQYKGLTVQEWSSLHASKNLPILEEVLAERYCQDQKWGLQDHTPFEWLSILTEEVGEVAQEANRMKWGGKSHNDYYYEMLQVAAVAVAALENMHRQLEASNGL